MSSFKDVFNGIANAIQDLSTLDVVTYKGRIDITAQGVVPTSFDEVLKQAQAHGQFRVLASTTAALDGDTKVFIDQDATEGEVAAHQQLVDSATAKRLAVVQLFETAIANTLK
ncbi:MAG: hypothetical protein ACK5QH_09035 [Rubrivivax sp.]|jgi:hypothetical protein